MQNISYSILIQLELTGLYRGSYFLIKVVVSKASVNTAIAHENKQEIKVCALTGIHYTIMASYADTMSAFISWESHDIYIP